MMPRKFVKRSKFSTISSNHACRDTLTILPVGRGLHRYLFAGSSYIKPRPAAVILRCSLVARRRSTWQVGQCHHKQRLRCWWQRFMYAGVEFCDRFSYGNTYIKIRTIQRRLLWPLHKDGTKIREAFQIFSNLKWPWVRKHPRHTASA